jgi:hypothetical protein
MLDEMTAKRVVQMHQEKISIRDIAQKLQIKKHLVESVLQSVRKNTDNRPDSPADRFLDSSADKIGKQKDSKESAEVERLRLELAILQEKNRAIELQNKQTESKEMTERERLKLQNSLEQRRLDIEQKKIDAEQKRHQWQVLTQVKAQTTAKEQKAITALQTKINSLLSEFIDNVDDDLCVWYDQDECAEWLKNVKSLEKSYQSLFTGIDTKQTLHGKALAILAIDFALGVKDSDGGSFEYDHEEFVHFENCLVSGVVLGDSEVPDLPEEE